MKIDDQEENISSFTHTTKIGSVTGQVHTGSGDIIIKNYSSDTISSKDDFLLALRAFKMELDAARQKGLHDKTADEAIIEVEAAVQEAQKANPKSERITKRLEKAKEILVAGAGFVTAATGATAAVNKLIPILKVAIDAISKIF